MKWPDETPPDCPFERSRSLRGLIFSGRYVNYTDCDYWYPTWASDGHLYSGCGDGQFCRHRILNAGLARISGDDPLNLTFTYLGNFNVADFTRASAYISSSLIKDGVWYAGLEEGWNSMSAETREEVAHFWGFLCCRRVGGAVGDLGYPFPPNPDWDDRTLHPLRRSAGETHSEGQVTEASTRLGGFFHEPRGGVHIRNLHFVDFGKELEHSPDGKVYAVAHGSSGKKPAEWGNGDSIYLLRVACAYEAITDPTAWEFFAGSDAHGQPRWVKRIDELKPLLSWSDKLGLVHVAYNAPLKKYLMWISPLLKSDTYIVNVGPTDRFSAEGSLLLESDRLVGPWRLVQYFHGLGPNAYCICFPSKFISADGKRAWLLCSANYTEMTDPGRPVGMQYAAHFREVEFILE